MPNKNSRELHDLIRKLGSNDRSSTIVIISPHGLRLSDSIGIINTESLKANLNLRTKRIRRKYSTDRELAMDLVSRDTFAQEVSFVTSSGPLSTFPLDFGSVIPLYFFSNRKVVSIGQPRIWNKDKLINFGSNLARAVLDYSEPVSVIISADQAHTHSPTGPYGYAEESSLYENLIEECVVNSDFDPLMRLDKEIVDRAKPDSYWNMLILKGFMNVTGMSTVLDYHYVERYFGMLLAHLI